MSVPNRFQTATLPLALSSLDANFDYITALLPSYALLASPAFTGIPTAPTASVGTSTTQIATTAYVFTNFVSANNAALTGVPTAPTAAGGTNTTQIATTAFVTSAVTAATAGVSSFNTRTGAITLTSGDVTTALGFTPITAAGAPVQSVFGRTGTVVLNSGDVTTALGFTPYNATNPNGYITSAALTPYALLAGAPFTGAVSIAAPNFTHLTLNPASGSNKAFINKNSTDLFIDINRDTNTGTSGDVTATHSRIRMSSGASAGYIAFYSSNTNNTLAPEVFRVGGDGNISTSAGGLRVVSPNYMGLNVVQAITPTFYTSGDGGARFNQIVVTENMTVQEVTNQFLNALYIGQSMDGAFLSGGRNVLEVALSKNAATLGTNTNRNFVAAAFTAEDYAGEGGTLGAELGGVFGINAVGTIRGTAAHVLNVTSAEFNVAAYAGTSVMYKSGIQIVQTNGDAVSGSAFDAAISLSNIVTLGWTVGLLFSAANSQHPVKSTGTLIKTIGGFTVDSGIDFSSYTFTTNFLNSTGFTVAGTGKTLINNAFGATYALGVVNSSNLAGAYALVINGGRAAGDAFVIEATNGFQTQLRVTGDSTNPFWVVVNGILKQVTYGAADSGGVGFRLLRVSN